ncbi:hypothetical protein E6O75_ATG03503 [Venturia nashicola]|uniref:Uncharacterized protein n=1 Tax=Venturia nashicola TaxID=86259 RepID=A0A4Z1PP14_9PEZI|nr:hypothetical protein E6O75_ATG03503 [Venturia nashicola]
MVGFVASITSGEYHEWGWGVSRVGSITTGGITTGGITTGGITTGGITTGEYHDSRLEPEYHDCNRASRLQPSITTAYHDCNPSITTPTRVSRLQPEYHSII